MRWVGGGVGVYKKTLEIGSTHAPINNASLGMKQNPIK